MVVMILVSKELRLLGCNGTISAAWRPVAVIIVETTQHLRSKFPWAPCSLSSNLLAHAIRCNMSVPKLGSLVVHTPAPSDLNSVKIGKGFPPHPQWVFVSEADLKAYRFQWVHCLPRVG